MPARFCGESREIGGFYAVSSLGEGGSAIENFLVCSPIPFNGDARDFIGRPCVRPRVVNTRLARSMGVDYGFMLPDDTVMSPDPNGNDVGLPVALVPNTKTPIYDLYIWIGAEYYDSPAWYIEETRVLGASRRISSQITNLDKLTFGYSRMALIHPKAIVSNYQELPPPLGGLCPVGNPSHTQHITTTVTVADTIPVAAKTTVSISDLLANGVANLGVPPLKEVQRSRAKTGSCYRHHYNLIPAERGVPSQHKFVADADTVAGYEGFELENGAVISPYQKATLPCGFSFNYVPYPQAIIDTARYAPGIFAMLPLTRFEAVKVPEHGDSDKKEKFSKAKRRIQNYLKQFELREVDE